MYLCCQLLSCELMYWISIDFSIGMKADSAVGPEKHCKHWQREVDPELLASVEPQKHDMRLASAQRVRERLGPRARGSAGT